MNKQKLLSLIDNPKTISQSELHELESLVAEHPYFQVGHVLVAKVKYDNKTLDYKHKLNIAALTTPERSILKEIIEDQSFSEITDSSITNESSELSSTQEEPVTSDVEEKVEEVKEIEEVQEEVQLAPQQADEKPQDEPSPIADSTNEAEHAIEEKKEELEEEMPTDHSIAGLNLSSPEDDSKVSIKEESTPQNDLLKELEENLKNLQRNKSTNEIRQANAEAAAAAEAAALKAKTPVKKPAAKTSASRAKSSTTRKAPATKTTRTATKKTTSSTSAKKPATTRKTTAKATTSRKTTAKASTTTKPKTTAKKPAASKSTSKASSTTKTTRASSTKKTATTAKKKLQKVDSPTKKTKPTKKAAGPKNQNDIIEAFIRKEPRISKPKEIKGRTEKAQEDLSVKSVQINEDLISENLAIIMEKQGKIQKAKDIYKKLIWKFPQKKAYFASRIEELDNQK